MATLQNAEWLGMAGKGTIGGQLRADGSDLEAGIHLRWQMAPELGFPSGGFDIYRRKENYRKHLRCGTVLATDLNGAVWYNYDTDRQDGLTITPSGDTRTILSCHPGEIFTAQFMGPQKVRLDFKKPARYLRFLFGPETSPRPRADAYWHTTNGDVLVATASAQKRGEIIGLHLFADRIDHVVLSGENMVICKLCFVQVADGYKSGWSKYPINGDTPIYLPVTHPDWPAPHPHTPDDQAEAEARLPVVLDAETWEAYATGFRDELHPLLYDLAGTNSHHLHRFQESDTDSDATIDWPGMSLLQLMALDPNIARILGLYWHDVPPDPDVFYDYRLVGHYEDQHYPGKHLHFSELTPGTQYQSAFTAKGVDFVSANPIDVVRAFWDGSEHTALRFTREILFAPISVQVPLGAKSITMRLTAEAAATVKVYYGSSLLYTEPMLAGDHTLHFDYGKSMTKILILPLGDITLFEMIARNEDGAAKDITYDLFHIRSGAYSDVFVPDLEQPRVVSSETGIDENGLLMPHQSRVGLRWERLEAGGNHLKADAPLLFHIQRDELADDDTPLNSQVLNEQKPALIAHKDDSSSNNNTPYYSDIAVPDGRYAYRLRGIDIFGVLGDWGNPREIIVEDKKPPPPPQAVKATYLDPDDPYLSEEDLNWTDANGPGLKVSWEWPGMFRLQAPDVVPSDAEFRIYASLGEMNGIRGQITRVDDHGTTSELTTNIEWPRHFDDLAGESIRINDQFFSVVSSIRGADFIITVNNLMQPDQSPETGPFSLVFSQGKNYWKDYGLARSWDRRIYTESVTDAPILAAGVVSIEDYDANLYESPDAVDTTISRKGATRTVTLDQPLTDQTGTLLPGVLFCEGLVYRVYGHTLGDQPKLHLIPRTNPTNADDEIEPSLNATCEYYPGLRYETKITGFQIPIPLADASAAAYIAMTCSDGHSHTDDDPIWDQAGKGGLGSRPGNESALSPAVKVMAVKRTAPTTVTNVPSAPPDPIFAKPADYYGNARYTLSWDAVPDTAEYAIYRCSGAMLYDWDRMQREQQKGYYQTSSVFADDTGFASWLAASYPELAEADMTTDPVGHREAWRAWANRFYPSRSDIEIQELASRAGNEAAFRRINKGPVLTASYDDTLDGRGNGLFIYRIRTVDAAGNLSTWSDAFPPVHIFDVTPPAMPMVTEVIAGQRSILINWQSNREKDLATYWLWQAQDPFHLEDIRRVAPTSILSPVADAAVVSYSAEGLPGATRSYFRLAAVDTNGNCSKPTPIFAGQAIDTIPPDPPAWIAADWNPLGRAIELNWQLAGETHEALVQRQVAGTPLWLAASGWLEAGTQSFLDTGVDPTRSYNYRILVRSDSGLLNEQFAIHTVPSTS